VYSRRPRQRGGTSWEGRNPVTGAKPGHGRQPQSRATRIQSQPSKPKPTRKANNPVRVREALREITCDWKRRATGNRRTGTTDALFPSGAERRIAQPRYASRGAMHATKQRPSRGPGRSSCRPCHRSRLPKPSKFGGPEVGTALALARTKWPTLVASCPPTPI
jgi:hypothetical protein